MNPNPADYLLIRLQPQPSQDVQQQNPAPSAIQPMVNFQTLSLSQNIQVVPNDNIQVMPNAVNMSVLPLLDMNQSYLSNGTAAIQNMQSIQPLIINELNPMNQMNQGMNQEINQAMAQGVLIPQRNISGTVCSAVHLYLYFRPYFAWQTTVTMLVVHL